MFSYIHVMWRTEDVQRTQRRLRVWTFNPEKRLFVPTFSSFPELPFHTKIPLPLLNLNVHQYYFNNSAASVRYIFLYPSLPPEGLNP